MFFKVLRLFILLRRSNISYTYVYHITFIPSSNDKYLNCFHILVTMNNDVIKIKVQTSLTNRSEVILLDNVVILVLISWGLITLFLLKMYRFVFSPRMCKVSLSSASYQHLSLDFFYNSHSNCEKVVFHFGCNMHFCLENLNAFSNSYWLCVRLLWKILTEVL